MIFEVPTRHNAKLQQLIEAGIERPVRIAISLGNSAGIFQVDELLKRKLKNSTLAPYVEVEARIAGETERRLLEVYEL